MRAPNRLRTLFAAPLFAPLLSLACASPPPPPPLAVPAPPAEPPETAPAPPAKLDRVPRADFNRIAAELAQPFFWSADANENGALDPDEAAVLWGVAKEPPAAVESGRFTPAFLAAYDAIAKVAKEGHPAPASDAEKKRRAAVLLELSQGRPTLVRTDLRAASDEDRAIVRHVLRAAEIVERIHAKQKGTAGMAAEIPPGDGPSRMLFYRNQGPWCEQPKTEKDADCGALARKPPRVSGLYPASIQKDPAFCTALEARKDQKELLAPFSVVVEANGDLRAVPYHEAYAEESKAIAAELRAAADAVKSPGEAAFRAYLTAAAQAFMDGSWEAADEAWAKMNAENSKWYLRIGPDEVYFEPCSRKAGYHVSFARINQDSLAWQRKLDPHKNEMEAALAKLAGPPYKARSVSFHLPDFIDIVLNAGDSRSATGGTIGQSLPNWGPVANQGRGRTVVMTNLYADADSRAALRDQAASLFCKATMDALRLEPELAVTSTILHEAAHNLGPSHEYQVKGKTDEEAFGGPLASTLEELKAQTSAMYLADWLAERKVIEPETAKAAHLRDIVWGFGHVANGMYTADGKPKPYSQLASIQLGHFLGAGALAWKAEDDAANGQDQGCFEVALDKLPPAVASLEKAVLGIKARGDKPAALALRKKHVDDDGTWKKLRATIQERWLRAPKASFVYAVEGLEGPAR